MLNQVLDYLTENLLQKFLFLEFALNRMSGSTMNTPSLSLISETFLSCSWKFLQNNKSKISVLYISWM